MLGPSPAPIPNTRENNNVLFKFSLYFVNNTYMLTFTDQVTWLIRSVPPGGSTGGMETVHRNDSQSSSGIHDAGGTMEGSSSVGVTRTRRPEIHASPYPPPGSQKRKGAVQKPVYSNVELWTEPEHPAALPYIYNWKTALAATDKNMERVHPNAPKLAYYFPTPTLFLRVASSDRRMCYLTNWLPIRSAWISRLSSLLEGLSQHLTATTYSSSLKKEAAELFRPVSSLPFEVLQIFPGDGGQTMCSIPFPVTNEGLVSSELGEKRHYVEKLRLLISSWPDFPTDIADILLPSSTLDEVWSVKQKVALFYCQTFFDRFGRPPIVPHQIPAPPHVVYSATTG
ncbi:hypothetical protein BU15DRAFT_59933 [Melanogaster broomeanus]|nr:hypothetical protein BU15DRAFT_59933 [Melanogaster broomeanus]